MTLSVVLVELRVVSAGGFGLKRLIPILMPTTVSKTYPIHCSAGGSPGGLIADNGDSRRCFNSSGVYLIAMVAVKRLAALWFSDKPSIAALAGPAFRGYSCLYIDRRSNV